MVTFPSTCLYFQKNHYNQNSTTNTKISRCSSYQTKKFLKLPTKLQTHDQQPNIKTLKIHKSKFQQKLSINSAHNSLIAVKLSRSAQTGPTKIHQRVQGFQKGVQNSRATATNYHYHAQIQPKKNKEKFVYKSLPTYTQNSPYLIHQTLLFQT